METPRHQSLNGPSLPRGPHAISAAAVAADQRRRLLDALPRAVAENGYEGTTVDHIVRLAQVRRNSFYEQFEGKQDCFATSYEIAQERLLGVLTFRCYTQQRFTERVDAAIGAGLDWLSAHPATARLLTVEAPAAGAGIVARHYRWLDRYGGMLDWAGVDSPDVVKPRMGVAPAIVGGIASRIKQLTLAGNAADLHALRPELVQFLLSFYGARASSPEASAPADRDGEPDSAQPQSPDRSSVLEPA